jgi:hypothetical protein
MDNLTHIDLFSGIGGFALSARWCGLETVAFCEIDPFCQRVLAKNFPGVPIYDDVRTFPSDKYSRPFLLTGVFPCQPYSVAGLRRGAEDDRAKREQQPSVSGDSIGVRVGDGFQTLGNSLRAGCEEFDAPGLAARPGHDSRKPVASGRKTRWAVEPAVGRVAHGIPRRVDRLKGLGNAIVPQVAAEIIWAMMENETNNDNYD